MNRTTSETGKVLGGDASHVKHWASVFKDYLSAASHPSKGKVRMFSDNDFLVLCYVGNNWEDDPDLETIKIGLNREEHHEERFVEHLYLHTPLLQEPPDDLDETWRHGVLWTGGDGQKRFELARHYRYVAEKMLEQALESGALGDLICPVLFAYRHTLELYLKSLGEIHKHTHSLTECVKLVEERCGRTLGSQAKGWIEELDSIDPHPGTTFRYEDI